MILVILASSGLSQAQDPWAQSGLVCLIQGPTGGTTLKSAPNAAGGTFLPNGTPVNLLGDASGGVIPVSTRTGRGYVDYRHLGAVGDGYMPSASGAGTYLPVQPAPGSQNVTLVIDTSGGVIRITLIPAGGGSGSVGGMPMAPGAPIGLLGLSSGGPLQPGTGAGGGSAPATGPGPAAPPPVAAPAATAGGWQTRITATAQGGGTGAGGARLVSSNTYCALPSRSALNRTMQIQLADAQGNGYGQALSSKVLDVGPWRVADNYWDAGRRPAAEAMKGQRVAWQRNVGYVPSSGGRMRCNGAGLDISFGAWTKLQPGLSLRQAANKTGVVNWTFGATTRAD